MHAEVSSLDENLKVTFKVIKEGSGKSSSVEDKARSEAVQIDKTPKPHQNGNLNGNGKSDDKEVKKSAEVVQKSVEPMVCIPNQNLKQTNNQVNEKPTSIDKPLDKIVIVPENKTSEINVRKVQVPKTIMSASTQTFFRAKMGSFSSHKNAAGQRPAPYPANLGLVPTSSKRMPTTQSALIKKPIKTYQPQTSTESKLINKIGQQTKQLTYANLHPKLPPLCVPMDNKISSEKSNLKIATNSSGLSLSDISKAHNFYKQLAEVQKNYVMSPTISSSQPKIATEIMQNSLSGSTEKASIISIESKSIYTDLSKPNPVPIPLAKIKNCTMNVEPVAKMKEMIFQTTTYGDVEKLTSPTIHKQKEAIKATESAVRTSPLKDKIPLFITESPKSTADFSKPSLPPIDSIDPADSIEILVRDIQLARDIKKIQDSLCTMNNSDVHSLINSLKLQQASASRKAEVDNKNQTPINFKKMEMDTKPTNYASMQNLSIRQIPNPIQMLYNRSKKNEDDNQTAEKEKFEDIEDLIKVSKLKKDQKNSNLEKLVKLMSDKKSNLNLNDKNNNNHDISVNEKM
jgi:hypothetical protein